jgi:hypothetical protein
MNGRCAVCERCQDLTLRAAAIEAEGMIPPAVLDNILFGEGNAGAGKVEIKRITEAAWVFTRSGRVWTQQGSKLVGTGAVESEAQGFSSCCDDGKTAVVGGLTAPVSPQKQPSRSVANGA